MITEKSQIRPKGQVFLRKMLRVGPGSTVIFRVEGDRVVLEKDLANALEIFEEIARKGRSISRINLHEY